MSETPEWRETGNHVEFSLDGEVYFRSDLSYWRDGVLRLLGLSEPEGKSWIEAIAFHASHAFGRPLSVVPLDEAVEALAAASAETFPRMPFPVRDFSGATISFNDEQLVADTVWATAIGKDSRWLVLGDSSASHGWLADAVSFKPLKEDPALYAEDYFEGAADRVGYGAYLDQAPWRLEKAARQMREVAALWDFHSAPSRTQRSLLDVGSGYGFFRKAADDAGWRHDGVEVSRHARAATKELFGFDTRFDSLNAVLPLERYDVVTMWDFLEHVSDPSSTIRTARELVAPGGALFVRTPNLLSIDREVFGSHYHSLKREHLHYFSVQSLVHLFGEAGLDPVFAQTDGRLLRGLLGRNLTAAARLLRGSDLLAMARKSE